MGVLSGVMVSAMGWVGKSFIGVQRYWLLDAGYWILDSGYWMLDTGYWLLVTGY